MYSTIYDEIENLNKKRTNNLSINTYISSCLISNVMLQSIKKYNQMWLNCNKNINIKIHDMIVIE